MKAGVRLAVLVAAVVAAIAYWPDARPGGAWVGPLSALPCGPSAIQLVAAWGGSGEMLRAPPGASTRVRYRIQTARVGSWIEVEVFAGGPPMISRVTPVSTETASFDADCFAVVRSEPGDLVGVGGSAARFTDEDLRRALTSASQREGRGGVVVYVWSPHMPLSVEGYAEVVAASQALGLVVEPVLLPDADADLARREAERVGIPTSGLAEAASLELSYRDALLHAPTVVVFTEQSVSPPLRGYRDRVEYLAFLEEFLAGP